MFINILLLYIHPPKTKGMMSTAKIESKVKISYACPKCGGDLSRINRRSVDKLINILVSVRRFKCYGCLWEGNRHSSENN